MGKRRRRDQVMAPPGFNDVSSFEGSQIAASVNSDQAMDFFEKYGIFYQEHREVGDIANMTRGAQITPDNLSPFRTSISNDPRLSAILQSFIERDPILAFTLGSHIGPTKGVTASNGLVHRPYKHLSETKGL